MRKAVWMLFGAIGLITALAAAPALADGGNADTTASADQVPWARWQGRLSLGTPSPAWRLGVESRALKLNNASLMGDYYFSRSLAGPGRFDGFRATSGLIFGARGALGTGAGAITNGSTLSIGRRPYGPTPMPATSDGSDSATVPYLGVGYTGLSLRGGLSFSADFGMVAQTPGNGARLGRAFGTSQSLDDTVRDLRLAPLLQLGVSYAF